MSQATTTPAVIDVTPARCKASFVRGSRGSYHRLHLLETAPEPYLGSHLMAMLALYLNGPSDQERGEGRGVSGAALFFGLMQADAEFEKFQSELQRYHRVYREKAQALPDLTLRQRRALSPKALAHLTSAVFVVADLLGWLLVLIHMEAIVLGRSAKPTIKKIASTRYHKLADKLRIWAWRQTPAGKKSIKKSNRRAQRRKEEAARAAA